MNAHAFRSALLFSTLAWVSPAIAQKRSPELEKAQAQLDAVAEQEVHSGGDACARANSGAAVELLLAVLEREREQSRNHLPPAHYRDIAFEYLEKITDPYARQRVEQELKKNQDPWVRQWCAELLGIYGDQQFGDTLKRALHDKVDGVQQWAAWSLGRMKYAQAEEPLGKLTRSDNEYVRANAIEALVRIAPDKWLPSLLRALTDDRSGGVRCALLGVVPELCADRIEEVSTLALRDPDWRPRMQAVENLGKVRTKSAVDALVRAAKDVRPVVGRRALRELQELTGQPITNAEVWEKWWADHRETFEFPEGRGKAGPREGGTVTYHALPVDSDHVAFMIDKSFRMQEPLSSKGKSKDEAAREELGAVLERLPDGITFNVFNYHTEVEALSPKPVETSKRNRTRAIAFVEGKPDGRAKDIWQVLTAVVADATLDTAYLLSSGEPDTGVYVHWNRVTRHLADLNRFHKVVIHAVAYSDNDWYRQQLQKIAEVTGGEFQSFQ